MSEELKPCPFCGANDAVETDMEGMRRTVYFVSCNKCGAAGPSRVYPDHSQPLTEADLWNRRATPAPESGDDTASRHVTEIIKAIHANRDKLLEAWIAETGLGPSESMLVEQHMDDGTVRVYVKRKEASQEQSDRKRAEAFLDAELNDMRDSADSTPVGTVSIGRLAALLAEVRAEERERCVREIERRRVPNTDGADNHGLTATQRAMHAWASQELAVVRDAIRGLK